MSMSIIQSYLVIVTQEKKIPTSVFVWRLFLMIEGVLQIQDKEGKYGEQLKYMFFLLTSYDFGMFRAF